MALDPERALFLLSEYRFSESANATVLADYSTARRLQLDTNLATPEGGQMLADAVLSLLQTPARAFEVAVEAVDVADLAQFDGSPPAFALVAPRFAITDATTLLPAAVEIDHAGSTTLLTLRG